MTDKGLQGILILIRKIDNRLQIMQSGFVLEKLGASYRHDYRMLFDIYLTYFILICQISILIIGALYLILTKEVLPPLALIGIIGIAFALLGSILEAARKSYLYNKIESKNNANLKYYEDIEKDLARIKEMAGTNAKANEIIEELDMAYSRDALDMFYEDILEKIRRSVDERSGKNDKNTEDVSTASNDPDVRTMEPSP